MTQQKAAERINDFQTHLINLHVISKLLVFSVIHIVLGIFVLFVVRLFDAHDVAQFGASQFPLLLLSLKITDKQHFNRFCPGEIF